MGEVREGVHALVGCSRGRMDSSLLMLGQIGAHGCRHFVGARQHGDVAVLFAGMSGRATSRTALKIPRDATRPSSDTWGVALGWTMCSLFRSSDQCSRDIFYHRLAFAR